MITIYTKQSSKKICIEEKVIVRLTFNLGLTLTGFRTILPCFQQILQESEVKLEMKNFKPASIFVGRYVTLGDKQKQPYLDRQMYHCYGNRTRWRRPQDHVLSKSSTLKK